MSEHRVSAPAATVTTLSTVEPERTTWLWPGRLPLGKLIGVDADPSSGKTTMVLDWAARLSTGKPWPDGAENTPGDALYLTAEDGIADTIVPRLLAADGDLTRVHTIDGVSVTIETEGGTEQRTVPVSLPRDIDLIEQVVRQHSIKLVVFD